MSKIAIKSGKNDGQCKPRGVPDFKFTKSTRATNVTVRPEDPLNCYGMSIPVSSNDYCLNWVLRYGSPDKSDRLCAAGLITCYDYLLSENITQKEAIERLRILRSARKQQYSIPTPNDP